MPDLVAASSIKSALSITGNAMGTGNDQTITGSIMFNNNKLLLWNPAGTFKYIIATSAIITADKTVTLPLLLVNGNFVITQNDNDFGAATNQIFRDSTIRLQPPAGGPYYTLGYGTAPAGNRTISIPPLASNDTWAFLNEPQIFTQKTIDVVNNVLALRHVYARISKVGSTYYGIKFDGTLISSNSTYKTVLDSSTAACSAAGGGVVFHRGNTTYSAGSSLITIPDNVSIHGEDMNSTIIAFSNFVNFTHAIELGVGTVLKDIKIVGDISTLRNLTTGDIIVKTDCIIENVWLSNMAYGFNLYASGVSPYPATINHVRFRNIKCDNIKGIDDWSACIHCMGGGVLGNVNDVTINGFSFINCNRAIEIENGPTNIKSQNGYLESIKNFNSTGVEAFSLDVHAHINEIGPENITYRDITLKDCQYPTAKHTGTSWTDTVMPKNILFDGITIDTPHTPQGFSGHGITLRKVKFVNNNIGTHFSVQRNSRNFLMENCESDALHTSHVWFAPAHTDIIGVTVRNSRVKVSSDKDTTGNKVVQLLNATDILFENNIIEDAKSDNAILIDSTAVKTIVRDNYITFPSSSPANYGIWSQGVDVLIEGNRFGLTNGPVTAQIAIRTGAIRNDVSKNFITLGNGIWIRNTASYTNVHDNIIAPSITGILVEATATELKIVDNINFKSENGGLATFSGNASTKVFNIAHGLAAAPLSVPGNGGYITVLPNTDDAVGNPVITYDSTNIIVTYAVAPPSGTNNIKLIWRGRI